MERCNYTRIKEGLYLVEQPLGISHKPAVQLQTNHIWIYDRSGSMWSQIRQLCEDIKSKVREIPSGDTISVGWFSTEKGEYNWVLKGYKVTDAASAQAVDRIIDRNNTTIGLTCFSEILTDTLVTIEDLSPISSVFALAFFTDGYPVVSNYQKEVDAIMSALGQMNGKVGSAVMIGYGDYYNKDLLSKMAARIGGQLVHASRIQDFTVSLERLIHGDRAYGKVTVEPQVLSGQGIYFSIENNGITLYQTTDEDTILMAPSQAADTYLYIVASHIPDGARELSLDNPVGAMGAGGPGDRMLKASYAAAYALVNKAQTDVAIDILGKIGDVALIKSVTNAYTNEEYGKSEKFIVNAMNSPSTRFMEGCDTSFVPKADAFCLLDALDILLQDEQAFFYPRHPNFKYKRIGPPSKQEEGYPKFISEVLARCPLKTLVWNQSKLNLSVLAKIPGRVELKEGYATYGFQQFYPTFQHRNYTLVKDGFLNITSLPASMSKETFAALQGGGLIGQMVAWGNVDTVYTLDLTRIPIINRKIAESGNSAAEVCRKAWWELELEAQIKALKFIRNEIDPEGDRLKTSVLSKEQEEFLASQGITEKGYQPPTVQQATTDKYFAKEFQIKIKGFSSLPKVADVRDKVLGKDKKPMKPGEVLIARGLELYLNAPIVGMSDEVKLTFLDQKIAELKRTLFAVRSEIQRTKFAIILAKKWFREFSSRDNCELELSGIKYTIDVREVEVAI